MSETKDALNFFYLLFGSQRPKLFLPWARVPVMSMFPVVPLCPCLFEGLLVRTESREKNSIFSKEHRGT